MDGKYTLLLSTLIFITIIIFIILLLSGFLIKWKKKQFYLSSDIKKIDHLSGIEFEEYLAAHFRKSGYKVFTTPKTNDYGADLIIKKNGEKVVVQAKRYKGRISNSAVQEVMGAIGYYNADRGMVITNSFFTANATELGKKCNVELWDRNTLIHKFKITESR